jgi:hypothetical protein
MTMAISIDSHVLLQVLHTAARLARLQYCGQAVQELLQLLPHRHASTPTSSPLFYLVPAATALPQIDDPQYHPALAGAAAAVAPVCGLSEEVTRRVLQLLVPLVVPRAWIQELDFMQKLEEMLLVGPWPNAGKHNLVGVNSAASAAPAGQAPLQPTICRALSSKGTAPISASSRAWACSVSG